VLNFVPIGQTVVAISQFWIFQDGTWQSQSWIFKIVFLTIQTLEKDKLRHCAKLRRNGRDIVIFRFFKMAAAAILDLENFTFLTVGTVKRFEMHNRAKFRQNRSNRGRDITIFQFCQDGGRPPSWICNACVGPPTKGIWWSLSLCKIWLESMQ